MKLPDIGPYVVVGSHGAIGKATISLLKSMNLPVIALWYRNAPQGDFFRTIRADMSDFRSVCNTAAELLCESERLSGLVYCAGSDPGNLSIASAEQWHTTFSVNAIAPIILSWELRHALNKGNGSVAIVGSVAANIATPNVVYGSSKAALVAAVRSTAWSLAEFGVRINVVNPGPVASTMTAQWSDSERLDRIQRTALKRIGCPEDIADAILFLLANESRHITGIAMDVSGGFELR